MSENSRTFLKSAYGFDAVVRRVAAGDWNNPSPCDGWTAADVLNHNLGMAEMLTGAARGAGTAPPGDVVAEDPPADWGRAFAELQDALDTRGALQMTGKTGFGEMPVDKLLSFIWVDPLLHTWDLAKATGQTPQLDSGLVERGYKRLLRAGDSLRGEGRFGAAVPERDDMSTLDRFVAISGRDPRWS